MPTVSRRITLLSFVLSCSLIGCGKNGYVIAENSIAQMRIPVQMSLYQDWELFYGRVTESDILSSNSRSWTVGVARNIRNGAAFLLSEHIHGCAAPTESEIVSFRREEPFSLRIVVIDNSPAIVLPLKSTYGRGQVQFIAVLSSDECSRQASEPIKRQFLELARRIGARVERRRQAVTLKQWSRIEFLPLDEDEVERIRRGLDAAWARVLDCPGIS